MLEYEQALLSGDEESKKNSQFAELNLKTQDAAIAAKTIIISQLSGVALRNFSLLCRTLEYQRKMKRRQRLISKYIVTFCWVCTHYIRMTLFTF